jgi:GNAT superfamily N-acetyltransferase
MIYRQATEKDLVRIGELWKEMVNEMRPEWTPNAELWVGMGKSLFEQQLINYTIIIAEEAGKIVGFVDGMIFHEPSTDKKHGVGQHFYVIPKYRKTRVAAKLYEEIVSVAVLADVDILEFFCFQEDLEFWGRRGYGLVRCLVRREVDV